jgi:hypothetical protein
LHDIDAYFDSLSGVEVFPSVVLNYGYHKRWMHEVVKGALAMCYRHLEYLDMSLINKYHFLFLYIKIEECSGAFMFFLNDILTSIPSLMKNMTVITILFLKLFERITSSLN